MIRKRKDNVEWLEFESLQEHKIRHAIFLRKGGYSEGVYSSLNLGASVGDDLFLVRKNKEKVMKLFSSNQLISGCQVHGVHIEEVKEGFICSRDCDGLITDKKEKPLTILHADCQAAIFYDPIHHRVANIHCGWKGNVQNIYQKTIDRFKAMGSNPSDLLVCISPSLGPNKAQFIHFAEEFPKNFHEFVQKDYLFNLWDISRMQLKTAGVLSSHIEFAEICTYENFEDFYSYRRDKITGRNATVVELL
ncbi:MAG: peptidoglycan editing factor PgeF [Verrucomicrobia bacterium]|nr:peptidoglycan editing factor PgeF [Verrucomicrobiota bacterium]